MSRLSNLRDVLSRGRPIAFLLAAALAAAGCGDDDDDRGDLNVEGGTNTAGETGTATTGTATTEAPTSGKPVATISVRETDFELSPKNPRISSTGVVTFRVRNAGEAPHALEVEGPAGEQETKNLMPGESATLKVNFTQSGRFKWYCPVGDHEARGMEGVITVAGAGSRTPDDKGGETRTSDDEDETSTSRGSGGGGSGRGEDREGGTGGGVSGY